MIGVRPLVVIWLAVAIGLGLLLTVARVMREPLDDPDPAWQRPGFLDAGDLPVPAAPVAPGLPAPGRATVVFFERTGRLPQLCRALAASDLPGTATATATAVVVDGAGSHGCEAADAVVIDRDGALAAAYGMRSPRGGGPPVGYAVVDSTGAIRYRTLDPAVADELSEVRTMVDALP